MGNFIENSIPIVTKKQDFVKTNPSFIMFMADKGLQFTYTLFQ